MAEGSFHPIVWAEQHPYMTAAIVFGGGLAVLYMLGYLGGGSGSAQSGAANMAAAYYAAEAQQAVAGTQLNMATVQANAQTQGQQIQANAALGIAQSNDAASVAIATHMYDSANVQANDAAAVAGVQAGYNYQTALAGLQAGEMTTAMNTFIPQELALSGGAAAFVLPGIGGQAPQVGAINVTGAPYTPAGYAQAGYTPQQIKAIFG